MRFGIVDFALLNTLAIVSLPRLELLIARVPMRNPVPTIPTGFKASIDKIGESAFISLLRSIPNSIVPLALLSMPLILLYLSTNSSSNPPPD